MPACSPFNFRALCIYVEMSNYVGCGLDEQYEN